MHGCTQSLSAALPPHAPTKEPICQAQPQRKQGTVSPLPAITFQRLICNATGKNSWTPCMSMYSVVGGGLKENWKGSACRVDKR